MAASFVNCMPSMGRCFDLMEQARAARLYIAEYGIDGANGIIKPFSRLNIVHGGSRLWMTWPKPSPCALSCQPQP